MKNTDLQIRKLNIIERLLILNDKKVISEMENLLNNAQNQHVFEPFTKQILIDRASKSENDIKNGDLILQADVEKMSSNW